MYCNFVASGCILGNVKLVSVQSATLLGSNRIEKIGIAGKITISSGASINLTSSISADEITVLTGGCTVNGNAIAAGTYTSIDSTGTPT
jgi:hypothetical protein